MKTRRAVLPLMGVFVMLALALPAAAETPISYAELVARLTDLRRLAVLPAAGESCRQWSSWDRSSRFDEATGRYVDWDANNDGPNFIRQEGDRFVLAEMEGPGCIWRIWSARAEKGHVRILLDGDDRPAVDLPFQDYFTGKAAPFDYPTLSYNLADHGCRGQNLYYPIPYQKSCKIVADEGWGRYYQFVYTTFPDGTRVPTFSTDLAAEHRGALQETNDLLARLRRGQSHFCGFQPQKSGQSPSVLSGDGPHEAPDEATVAHNAVSIGAGERLFLDLSGPRAITAIRGRMKFDGREDEMAALRKLAIEITWDGQPQPAVWCPLGDFFGTAPGVNRYRSLVTGVTDEGGYAHWYMPFEKSARIALVNDDDAARELEFEIVHEPLDRPFDGLGHFHLKWHRDAHELPDDRWPDWVMLMTEGRGRFCGAMLHVWDPRPGWWGEGDEKFFVDGEKYPSTFGTGSEDYFGYAWCDPGLFQRAFHGQTMTEGNEGHQSVFRWQVADNVPFQESFEAAIEKYHRTEQWGTQYATTVCWYLAPGGVDPYGPVPVQKRHGYYDRPPLAAGGFKILGQPKGRVRTQRMTNFEGDWEDGDQLWWTGASPGDTLDVAVPVEKKGAYRVSVVLTKARDYAIVELSIDGKTAGQPIDLYSPAVTRTEPTRLGTVELDAGEHVLGVRIAGANDKAVKSHMFGLDEVVLEPASLEK